MTHDTATHILHQELLQWAEASQVQPATQAAIHEALKFWTTDIYEILRQSLLAHYHAQLATYQAKIKEYEQKYGMDYTKFCEIYLDIHAPNLYENELTEMEWGGFVLQAEFCEKQIQKIQHGRNHSTI